MNYGGLYVTLRPIALGVVSRAIVGMDLFEMREVAHDITSDFLMCSKSFKEHFDKDKGSLQAFFASYAMKKCRGVRDRFSNAQFKFETLDEKIKGEQTKKDTFVLWEELMSRLNFYKDELDGVVFCSVDLSRLLGSCICCVLDEGRVIKTKLADDLGVSRESVRKALIEMQKRLVSLKERG